MKIMFENWVASIESLRSTALRGSCSPATFFLTIHTIVVKIDICIILIVFFSVFLLIISLFVFTFIFIVMMRRYGMLDPSWMDELKDTPLQRLFDSVPSLADLETP
ncbi:UNVERIFIED_CONTAM: hypothetical protein NCL1_48146 [Trichonephila clavipes]